MRKTEKKILNVKEHLNVVEVSIDGNIKRYEISPESGYSFYRSDENVTETGLVIFPAARGLENILSSIEVSEQIVNNTTEN